MRIVVLGGAGDMGSHVVRDLIEHSDARVVVADRRLDVAARLAAQLGERVEAMIVDATDERSLAGVLRDADAAVGCIGPFYLFAAPLVRAAIAARTPYVDICDDWGPVDEIHAMDDDAKVAGVPIVNGLGWTPGITNLMAKRAASELDEIEDVRISWAGGAADSTGLAVVMHLAYAVTGEVPTFRDGRRIMVPARSGGETVDFPPPLGPVKITHCGHPEPLTLGDRLKAPSVSLKGGLTPDWNNRFAGALARLGLFSTPERIAATARVIHRVEGVFRIGGIPASGARVDVVGFKDGRRTTRTYAVADTMGRLTGIPASIGGLMLARREIATPGVHAPEDVVEPGPFFDQLRARNIRLQQPA